MNNTDTGYGVVVNVSCDEEHIFPDRQPSIVSFCDSHGNWWPPVPDCVGG